MRRKQRKPEQVLNVESDDVSEEVILDPLPKDVKKRRKRKRSLTPLADVIMQATNNPGRTTRSSMKHTIAILQGVMDTNEAVEMEDEVKPEDSTPARKETDTVISNSINVKGEDTPIGLFSIKKGKKKNAAEVNVTDIAKDQPAASISHEEQKFETGIANASTSFNQSGMKQGKRKKLPPSESPDISITPLVNKDEKLNLSATEGTASDQKKRKSKKKKLEASQVVTITAPKKKRVVVEEEDANIVDAVVKTSLDEKVDNLDLISTATEPFSESQAVKVKTKEAAKRRGRKKNPALPSTPLSETDAALPPVLPIMAPPPPISESTVDKKPSYDVGDKVLCHFQNLLYDAVIQEIHPLSVYRDMSDVDIQQTFRSKPKDVEMEISGSPADDFGYFIHYPKWKTEWDEWVRSDCFVPITEEARKQQRELKKLAAKTKLKKPATKKRRRSIKMFTDNRIKDGNQSIPFISESDISHAESTVVASEESRDETFEDDNRDGDQDGFELPVTGKTLNQDSVEDTNENFVPLLPTISPYGEAENLQQDSTFLESGDSISFEQSHEKKGDGININFKCKIEETIEVSNTEAIQPTLSQSQDEKTGKKFEKSVNIEKSNENRSFDSRDCKDVSSNLDNNPINEADDFEVPVTEHTGYTVDDIPMSENDIPSNLEHLDSGVSSHPSNFEESEGYEEMSAVDKTENCEKLDLEPQVDLSTKGTLNQQVGVPIVAEQPWHPIIPKMEAPTVLEAVNDLQKYMLGMASAKAMVHAFTLKLTMFYDYFVNCLIAPEFKRNVVQEMAHKKARNFSDVVHFSGLVTFLRWIETGECLNWQPEYRKYLRSTQKYALPAEYYQDPCEVNLAKVKEEPNSDG